MQDKKEQSLRITYDIDHPYVRIERNGSVREERGEHLRPIFDLKPNEMSMSDYLKEVL